MSLSLSRSASLLRLSIIIVAAAAIERAAVIAMIIFVVFVIGCSSLSDI